MTLETFFEKFDQFADAPDAAVKMRELVLELAVRGRLLSSGNLDSSAPFDPSAPFLIPHDWQWIALNQAADCRAAAKVDSSSLNDSDWVLDLEDIDGGAGKVIATATFAERRSLSTKASFQKGDVLYGKLRPYLNKVVIADRPGFCTTEIIPLRPQKFVAAGYLRLFLRSPHFLRYAAAKNYGMKMPRLGTQDLESAAIPLPPLAEQKRIVAKVDELMALCDRLALQQQERETRHAALARASLARFADAPTPANLDFLFHPSYAIPPADLRKSILTLAVQGKLVPQDPNDEPAEELAAELARLKTQLLAGRRIRNQKVSGCPSEDDFPFEIPASWKWVRLGHAVTLLGGYAYESGAYVPTSSNQIIRLGNVKSDALLLDQKPAFIPDALAEQTAEYAILEGDILVTMTGTKAKRDYAFTLAVKRADLGGRRLFLNQRVGAIRPFQRELVPLINVFLKSDQLLDLVFATATGTANQANIGTASILDLPFPLPPLAEQRRIVAKVEQLMALVDALETQLAASRATAANLLSALVAELTAA